MHVVSILHSHSTTPITPPPPPPHTHTQNELNALSQYNDTAYYPNTDTYFNTIQAKVQEFFKANIQESLRELENYIIDFYVTPDKVRPLVGFLTLLSLNSYMYVCQIEPVRYTCTCSYFGPSDVFSWLFVYPFRYW